MKIPEWEIRDAICWNPSLLNYPHKLKLSNFQVHLKGLQENKFIDILFRIKDEDKDYLIVELKKDFADEKAVKQVLNYKKLFCRRGIPQSMVVPMVAAPFVSSSVKKICKKKGVEYSELDLNQIHKTRPRSELDDEQKKMLADELRIISNKNPLCAHEILGMDSVVKTMEKFDDKGAWFWLYYSILDGGGPAQTFIKGYMSLVKDGINTPQKIAELSEKGLENAQERVLESIERGGAVLFNPGKEGNINYGKAIVKAALLLKKYDFSFDLLYEKSSKDDNALSFLIEELANINFLKSKSSRRKKQFLRGMVLRGGWNLPVEDKFFMEKPSQSTHIMNVSRRLGIKEDMDEFCEKYLPNKAVLSHALWIIGKKYCMTNAKPRCNLCLRKICNSGMIWGKKVVHTGVGLDRWMK